jgi:putative spermidine/putrescine transport system ATP-binding protein
VTALIRPEDVALATADTEGALAATVVASSFLGSLRRTDFGLPDGTVIAVQHDVDDTLEVGATAFLRLKRAPVAASPRA